MPIQTIKLNASDKAFLPKTAKILSVDSVGGITLNPSECINTTPLPRDCYELIFNMSEPDGATGALEGAGPDVLGIFIANTLFTTTINLEDLSAIKSAMERLSGGAIANVTTFTADTDPSAMETNKITFKAPASIGDNFYLLVQESTANSNLPTPYRFYAKKVTCS